MIDRHDALDELIDDTARDLVAAPSDDWLLQRITSNLPRRRPDTWPSRPAVAAAIAMLAIVIGGVIVQRSFDGRSADVRRPFTESLPAQAVSAPSGVGARAAVPEPAPAVVQPAVSQPTILQRAVVRRTAVERPSNDRRTIVEEDVSPFPPVVVASLSFASLETDVLDETPGDVAPLVIDELPAVSGLSERQ